MVKVATSTSEFYEKKSTALNLEPATQDQDKEDVPEKEQSTELVTPQSNPALITVSMVKQNEMFEMIKDIEQRLMKGETTQNN
jgi:hypothetical protein